MSSISEALYESFQYVDEDFTQEILDSLEDTDSLQESAEENLWDKLEPVLEKTPPVNESLLKEDMTIDQALDEFYELMIKQDVPPKEAKARVLKDLGKEPAITESMELKEEKTLTRKERLAKQKSDRMKAICEEFRKSANFFLDEELTEDKLKYEEWRIKNLALRTGIPSAKIKEALLKGN